MWLMLQQDQAEDYVIATGESHSVRDLVEVAFAAADLPLARHLVIDPTLLRPAEVDSLVGDASKARTQLGWEPTVSFAEMIRQMVEADLKRLSQQTHTGPR
jgi:GDPmannose 4,6-dehydratase